uniref:Ribonuclease H2 subunit n=1 Tax=Kluyveromyces marxianus TaxID=4911 RepID=F4NCP1_KLUMA|nr:ribonuclease H2 subunit [Kluyveromyces marxianus]CCA89270.1 ribonuclease H2 subunit [Kluyveromyces marxianus]
MVTTTTTFVQNKVAKNYTAHLVPCKVRQTGPTTEFNDQFILDEELIEPTQQGKSVTYIRGRKIVGDELRFEDSSCFVVKTSQDGLGNNLVEPVFNVAKIVNYEREGNEERLINELTNFEELRHLESLIHTP